VLITVAVVPGPPALVAELMGSAAAELDELRDAADRAVSVALRDLDAVSAPSPSPAPGAGAGPASGSPVGQLVVVGPGRPGEYNAAGPVSFAGFGRDAIVPALVEGESPDGDLPTPLMVARYLASRDLAAHPEHARLWASARWVTTCGAEATTLGEELGADAARICLILVADGATCHGPKAPRAQDARAQGYDDGVCAALASGQPSRMAQCDTDLGVELGANGTQVWPVLVAATGARARSGGGQHPLGTEDDDGAGAVEDQDWIGEVLWAGAPYGVGWAVASWRRSCQ
jgi:hypothetical protein